MEYALRTVMFAFLIGVFSADNNEEKSVIEGDSVTLNPDLTPMLGINHKKWLFQKNGSTTSENIQNVEILKDRWKTNDWTGSLTINNLRTKHSGLYTLMIDRNSGPQNIKFTVIVKEVPSAFKTDDAEMKSLFVTEGELIILESNVTTPHGDELIVWRFGDEGQLLAKVDKETKRSQLYNTDEKFKDRLKLNDQIASLTIENMKKTDAGLYIVRISSNQQIIFRKFTVNVSASGLSPGSVAEMIIPLLLVFAVVAVLGFFYHRRKISELQGHVEKTISGEEGDSITLPQETEMQVGNQILWMFGPEDRLIAKGEINAQGFCTQDGAEGNISLDQTGSLAITNSTTQHSGVYKLQVISIRETKYKRFRVTIRDCETVVLCSHLVDKRSSAKPKPAPRNTGTLPPREEMIIQLECMALQE